LNGLNDWNVLNKRLELKQNIKRTRYSTVRAIQV
jgi:hypothetical protein